MVNMRNTNNYAKECMVLQNTPDRYLPLFIYVRLDAISNASGTHANTQSFQNIQTAKDIQKSV